MIVVDASVANAYLFVDEDSTAVNALFRRPDLIAPALLDVEVMNTILNNVRRGRLDVEAAETLRSSLTTISIERVSDPAGSLDALYPLCLRHNLSVYDGLYLDLALRRGASLATFDRRLRAAAEAEGVEVLPEMGA